MAGRVLHPGPLYLFVGTPLRHRTYVCIVNSARGNKPSTPTRKEPAMTETLTTTSPARATILGVLDLTDHITDRNLILTVEDGDYFKGATCEHPNCTHPSATSIAWIDREDGLSEWMLCGQCTSDALTVIRMSEDTDGSEDITVRVSPWWLLYVHEVAA